MNTSKPSSVTKEKEILPGIRLRPQIAQTQAGPIEYDLTDGNGPVILSLHGGIGGCDQGRLMAAWIDIKQYRILSPSRPGFLGTPLEVGKTMEEQSDAFAALLNTLNINKVIVMGASAGGPPAYYFAMRHPERVSGLIVIDGVSGFYDMPETAGPIAQAIFLSDLGIKTMQKISDIFPKMLLSSLFKAEALFSKKQLKKHIEYVIKNEQLLMFAKAFMSAMAPYRPRKPGTFNDIEQFRKYTHIPMEQIKCPSLIIHGTHDADVKFCDGVYAYEHIKNAERFWIQEGSHLGFVIDPGHEQAQEAARAFIRKISDI